jgi:phosphohistidine phosphatase
MDLILWRHCEAEAGEPDLGRRLTPKGHKQAERMAEWLERHLPDTARILVSPADRAQQTAQALPRRFRTLPELAPGASTTAVLSAANWPDSREPVLIVGHQPTLGMVAAYLMAGEAARHGEPWSIKKGSVWWLRHRPREDRGEVVLVAVRTAEGL